jgi:RNA-binding protein
MAQTSSKHSKGNSMQKAGATPNKIAEIDIRVSSHATEDEEKVQTAVKNLLPVETAESIVFEKTSLEGHHGNPIILISAKVTDKKTLPKALENFGSKLSSLDKETLQKDLPLHLEKSNLFLRFDKQSAYLGTIRFSNVDSIHVKVHFKTKVPEEIEEILRKSGLLP